MLPAYDSFNYILSSLVTVDDVLHKLVDILLHFPSGSHDLSPAERELDPSHMAIHLIKEVAQGNEMCQEILCKVSCIIYTCMFTVHFV